MQTICTGYLQDTDPEACVCSSFVGSALGSCLTEGMENGDFTPYSDKTGSAGVSTGTVVLIALGIVFSMSAVGIAYYRHTRSQMRDQVRSILAEYMPLEDMGDGDASGMVHAGALTSAGYAQADLSGSIQGV